MKMKTMLAFVRCAGGCAMALLGLGCAQIFGFDKIYEPEDQSSGGGGAAGSAAGSGGGAGNPCEILAVLPGETLDLSMIDDMEDGDTRISEGNGANPWAGFWFEDNDESPEGRQDPADPADLVSTLDPPRGASTKAVHTSADDGFILWGAGVGFHLDDEAYYDASGYRGLTFWARAEEGSTRKMKVLFIDQQTYHMGGICNDAEGECNNHFHKPVMLESEWKHFKIPVECLKQEPYGKQLLAPALERLWAIEFFFDKELAFELWIDDVAFYR